VCAAGASARNNLQTPSHPIIDAPHHSHATNLQPSFFLFVFERFIYYYFCYFLCVKYDGGGIKLNKSDSDVSNSSTTNPLPHLHVLGGELVCVRKRCCYPTPPPPAELNFPLFYFLLALFSFFSTTYLFLFRSRVSVLHNITPPYTYTKW